MLAGIGILFTFMPNEREIENSVELNNKSGLVV
jgi:hypothetical protein